MALSTALLSIAVPQTLIPLVSHTITPTCALRTRRSFQPPCYHALAEKLWEASKRLPASSAHSLNYIRHALAVQLHLTHNHTYLLAAHSPLLPAALLPRPRREALGSEQAAAGIQRALAQLHPTRTRRSTTSDLINAVQLHPTRTRSCVRAPHAPAGPSRMAPCC